MNVPFIDLRRFEDGFRERWADKCGEITAETRFVGGPDVARLERRLADAAGVRSVVGCANGTDALQLALRAAGVAAGDRVVVPDATFWATFEAVVNVGALPVTVDIDPADLQLDLALLQDAIGEYRPTAVILVHLYGWGSRKIDEIRALCRDEGLPLIEDGAQAFGVDWRGAPLFRDATMATVSFYPAKVLGACGDAGAVYCASEAMADEVRRLGNHGRDAHYAHGQVGWNSRMGGLEAAFLDLSLDYMDARLDSRRRAAREYRDGLRALGVTVAVPPEGYSENGYLSVALLEPGRRAAVEAVLRSEGIGFGNVYPGSVSEQPGAAAHIAGRLGGGRAANLGRGVLNLPLFAHIRDDEIERVLAVMAAALEATDDLGPRGPFHWPEPAAAPQAPSAQPAARGGAART